MAWVCETRFDLFLGSFFPTHATVVAFALSFAQSIFGAVALFGPEPF